MPFKGATGIPSFNCEWFAIPLENESGLDLIWLLTAGIRNAGDGFISLIAGRQHAVITKETAGMLALEIFTS
jgi:hypothetical protein